MLGKLPKSFNQQHIKQLTDVRNISLYIFSVVVLAITWSGVKTLQSNYDLQKQIATLKQQNAVIQLQNENTSLQNQYYQTNEYLDLAARQNLGLAAPGETVELIPKNIALRYVDQALAPTSKASNSLDNRSFVVKNFEAWRDFLLGRKNASSN